MDREPVMRRRDVVRLGAGAAALGALSPFLSLPLLKGCAGGSERRPNILFIFSDDHACQAISAYGSRINRTPNIDRIAREGIIFENSFCTNAICAPSRAVVLTGKFSHVNGKVDNAEPFDTSQPTFNKALQSAGYQTAMIGKWHLRNDPEGFDFWKVLPGQGHYYNPDFRGPEYGSGRPNPGEARAADASGGRPERRDGTGADETDSPGSAPEPDGAEMDAPRVTTERIEGYVTDIITEITLDWLRNGRDPARPFLLMCQHKAPHRNWMPGPDYLRRFEDVEIPEPKTLFDDYQDRANPASQQEMTIAEHMFPAYDLKITPPDPDDEEDANNWSWVYDRMTPAQKEAWEAAGVAVPPDVQGSSLIPLMEGETPTSWRKSIYYHYYEFPAVHMVAKHYGVRTERYKLIHYYETDEWECFDLERDPRELESVYHEPEYAAVVAELRRELASLRALYGDNDPA